MKVKRAERADLQAFVDVVKVSLEVRLNAVSLKLQDIGLRYGEVIDGKQTYQVFGLVERPITQQIKGFKVTVGGKIRHTEPADVEPLAKEIHKQIMKSFYETAPKIIQLRSADGA